MTWTDFLVVVGVLFAVLYYVPTLVYLCVKMATVGYYVGRESFVQESRRTTKGLNNGHSQG